MSLIRAILAAAQLAVGLCLCARLAGFRVPSKLSWTVVLFTFVVCGWVMMGEANFGIDAQIFWTAGRDFLDGHDPYARSEFLNPPTALPLFALLALIPLAEFLSVWKILCLLAYAVFAPACYAALRKDLETAEDTLTAADLGLLSAAVIASVSVRFAIILGQVPVLVALAAVGAIASRARNKPMGAGLLLALTSIKPTTMIPFLLLFPPWRQVKTWMMLALGGFALTFAAVRPAHLLDTLNRNLTNIRNSGLPGAVNDYSFSGPNTVDLLSLEYAIYHLGLRDRSVISVIHLVLVAALGIYLSWQIYRRNPLSLGAAASIVACYSAIFIYHRQYDAVILVIPLVYAVSRALSDDGARRWVYRGCVVGILGVLYEPLKFIQRLYPFAQDPGVANRLVEAVVLPLGTWLIVAISLMIAIAERHRIDAKLSRS